MCPQFVPITAPGDASGWQQTVMAFLAEKERRSGSRRTVEGYARMLWPFLGGFDSPARVTPAHVLAWAHGIGLSELPENDQPKELLRLLKNAAIHLHRGWILGGHALSFAKGEGRPFAVACRASAAATVGALDPQRVVATVSRAAGIREERWAWVTNNDRGIVLTIASGHSVVPLVGEQPTP